MAGNRPLARTLNEIKKVLEAKTTNRLRKVTVVRLRKLMDSICYTSRHRQKVDESSDETVKP